MRAYAFLGEALRAYQGAVVDLVRARTGLPLEPLSDGRLADLDEIASGPPALAFLCGLPYARARDRGLPLEPLVAPVGMAEPGDGPAYRSHLLGRPGLGGSPAARDGLRLAINGRDSLSGWVLPVADGLPLGGIGEIVETGSHVASMRALQAGEADVAPIDSMLLTAELAREPAYGELAVRATYGPTTSPPVVLIGDDPVLADTLRAALANLADGPEGRAALALGGMARLAPVTDAAYDPVRALDREAAACGR